ncbi:transaldolase [Actinopolyspora lacussalsi subsp. righensis]|uniref:Transaldolase n=1 Tax=Actinopolyspora righensis TaxID=995060 RepID=A0A1I6XK22_9ACTN|nr:transaldolase [Actinopolyspora righensis]SFT38392.1 transaldolase [Actinopolyspora righensis]
MSGNSNLQALSDAGVAIWLDDLSRQRINSGNLAELIENKNLVGVTSNPTIFASALSNAADYNDQVRELAGRGAGVEEAVRELMTKDIRDAADVFREVHTATGGEDGRISLEVDPRLAHDTESTVKEALELAKAVDRPNLFVKIPATVEGLPAITRTLAEGISVNVTLIFSVQRYREVMDAFITGLERARENGHDISRIFSVASFFVSRVDSEIDKRLKQLDGPEHLYGKAAIANARLAYAAYEEVFTGQRWQALEQVGAHRQRPLWASTGVKEPAYSDTRYVDELVAPNTVNTMPESTLEAVADHGNVLGDTVSGTAGASQQVFDSLSEIGIDLDDVYTVLEREGVEKFEKSWDELLRTVSQQLEQAR